MTSRDPRVCREFVARAKEALSLHPDLSHSWSIDADDDHCILEFPATSLDGFAVVVEVFPEMITVSACGYHQHLDVADDALGIVGQALGLARDLLSPSMRIRERRAGGTPYRWICEGKKSAEWRTEGSTSLMFWNYFGRRSERLYQNHALPEREEEANQPPQRNAGSRPSSDASPASETPSSLGPRG
jgi:hypothetical protein